MQLATLFAGTVEAALAQLLKQHPNPEPLAQWHGQVIRLQLQPAPFPLYLVMSNPIQVYSRYDSDVDCSLTLAVSALPKLKSGDSLTELSRAGEIHIDGDIKLAGKLASLLSAIEPDLAEPLSKLVGGAMAHRLDSVGKMLFKRASSDLKRLSGHSAVFVRDELQLGLTPQELNQFSDEVEQLQRQVASLAARLDKLENPA